MKFIIIKFIAIIICMGMLSGFWYSILTFAKIKTVENAKGVKTVSGGNLLTRSGAICDASDLAFEDSDGIDACRGTASAPGFPFGAGCFVDQPDRDGYRNRSLSLRGGYDASDSLSLQATALRLM